MIEINDKRIFGAVVRQALAEAKRNPGARKFESWRKQILRAAHELLHSPDFFEYDAAAQAMTVFSTHKLTAYRANGACYNLTDKKPCPSLVVCWHRISKRLYQKYLDSVNTIEGSNSTSKTVVAAIAEEKAAAAIEQTAARHARLQDAAFTAYSFEAVTAARAAVADARAALESAIAVTAAPYKAHLDAVCPDKSLQWTYLFDYVRDLPEFAARIKDCDDARLEVTGVNENKKGREMFPVKAWLKVADRMKRVADRLQKKHPAAAACSAAATAAAAAPQSIKQELAATISSNGSRRREQDEAVFVKTHKQTERYFGIRI